VTSSVTCLYFLNIQNHFVCVLNTVNNNFNSALSSCISLSFSVASLQNQSLLTKLN
jgi:hypothetical protein